MRVVMINARYGDGDDDNEDDDDVDDDDDDVDAHMMIVMMMTMMLVMAIMMMVILIVLIIVMRMLMLRTMLMLVMMIVMRILIDKDDVDACYDIVRMMMMMLNYRVRCMRSGRSGLDERWAIYWRIPAPLTTVEVQISALTPRSEMSCGLRVRSRSSKARKMT